MGRSRSRDNSPGNQGGDGEGAKPRTERGKGVSLLIRNLSHEVSPGDLGEAFSKYGEVLDKYIPLDHFTRRPRGFGFVEFVNREDAEKAMDAMDKTELFGRTLTVVFAKQSRKSPHEMMKTTGPRGGGGGRGRNRFGRGRGRSNSRPRRGGHRGRDRSRDRRRPSRRSRSRDSPPRRGRSRSSGGGRGGGRRRSPSPRRNSRSNSRDNRRNDSRRSNSKDARNNGGDAKSMDGDRN